MRDNFINNSLISNNYSETIGFILEYEYSINSTVLKGNDAIIYHLIKSIGKYQITLIPVIIKIVGDESGNTKSWIYPLTPEHLQYLINPKNKQLPKFPKFNLKFKRIGGEGYQWSCRGESEAKYCGNSYEYGNYDAIYFHRALICTPKCSSPTTAVPF